MDQIWQDYLDQGNDPDPTSFGVWLIREQPAVPLPSGKQRKENKTFESGVYPAAFESMDHSTKAAILVGRLQRFLHHLTKAGMKEAGMTEDEFVVLATLLYLPRSTKMQLLRQCLIEIPTGSELLKRMKTAGLILEKKNPDDARSSFISISAKGRAQLFNTFSQLSQVEDALSVLSQNEKDILIQLLDKLDMHHSRRHEIRQVKELMKSIEP